MPVADEISARLSAAFHPELLEVANESHRHAGHSGDDGTGETHFNVKIRATALEPLTRVARHRAIHAAIGPEVMARLHALAIDAA